MRAPIVAVFAVACGRIDIDPLHLSADAPSHDAGDALHASYAATVLADSPIIYFRFDDAGTVAHDSSPSGFDGTIGSSIVLGAPGLLANDPSSAIAIAGGAMPATANIAVDRLAALEPARITMEAWASTTSVAVQPILTYGESYQLYIGFDGTDAFEMQIDDNHHLASNVVATPFTTHYVVGIYDATMMTMYVDGVLALLTSGPAAIPYTGTDLLWIGGDNTGTYAPFVGTIDEVAIYDHALTAQQIAAHYAAR